LSFLAGFIFAFNPLLWESFFLQGGRYTMLNVLLFFTSLICLLLFLKKRKSVFFTLSIFFLVSQTFTFGFGIFLNFIYFLFFNLFSNRKKDKQKIILVFIVIISLTLLFIFFGSLKSLDLVIDKFPPTEKAKMISNYFYFAVISNFVRPFIFFILPSNFNVVSKKIYLSFFFFFLLIFYAFINDKKNKKILIWTLFYYLSFIISISLSRYDWGPAQSLSSRYIYNFLPALIILVCWLIDIFENKIKRFNNVLALSTVVFYSTMFIYNYKIVSFYKNLYSRLHYYNYSQLKKRKLM